MIQRVDEGPAIAVHPRAFRVRRINNSTDKSFNNHGATGGGGGASSSSFSTAAANATTAGVFPSMSDGEGRFSPTMAINMSIADGVTDHQASAGCTTTAATCAARGWGVGATGGVARTRGKAMLALYQYATVDFFIETAGCPTERDFLRLPTCVDVGISTVPNRETGVDMKGGHGVTIVLPVVLNEREHEPTALGGANIDFFRKTWRPLKRRGSLT